MNIVDSPLMAVVAIVTVATILALVRALKRDRCLMHFDDYHISLAEKDGSVTWGRVDVETSGLEIHYPSSRQSAKGFWKQSVLYFSDQYDSLDGLYRSTVGLSDEQCERRQEYLERTADPSFFRRLFRQIRNWMGMIRDSVVQAASIAVGAAKSKARPGMAVLTRDEERISALSSEVVGHAGNAYDPLLERHLFTRVIVDVTRDGVTYQYCGYLADYTKQFLEVIDAAVNPREEHFDARSIPVGDESIQGISVSHDGEVLSVSNETDAMLLLDEITCGDQSFAVGAVLPVEFTVELRIGSDIDADDLEVTIGAAGRIDMLVPRSHAIVRHGISGLDEAELQIDD